MSWREDLQDGSFRGAGFEVMDHEHQFGRRQEVHEYPLRDMPWAEDMGRSARRWEVRCRVIGADYMTARDALITAIETEGPGTLVHPYLGVHSAVCVGGQVRESTAEGGQAVFTLMFVEAGDTAAPVAGDDTGGQAEAAADQVDAAAEDAIQRNLLVEGEPAATAQAAQDRITALCDRMDAVAARIAGQGAPLFAYVSQIQRIRTSVIDLARSPGALASQIRSAVGALASLAAAPRAGAAALGSLAFSPSTGTATLASLAVSVALSPRLALAAIEPLMIPPPAGTLLEGLPSTGQQRIDNDAAIDALLQQTACGEAVRQVAQIAFTSYDDAAEIRTRVAGEIEVIETAAGDAGEDLAWTALAGARLAMVADVTARGGSLNRLLQLTLQAVQPALVIAYRLYADAGRELEIVERNRVRHPGFTPGGVSLEFLTSTDAEAALG